MGNDPTTAPVRAPGVEAQIPDLSGLSTGVNTETRRALLVSEVLGRAETITSTDFGPVHTVDNGHTGRFIVGKFGENAASTAPAVADFTIESGRVTKATINDPSVFPAGKEAAADALLIAMLAAIEKR